METMHGGCATIVPRHALHNNIIKRVPGRCLGGGVHIFVSQSCEKVAPVALLFGVLDGLVQRVLVHLSRGEKGVSGPLL